MTDWKPGDVANGHVLGDDLAWHKVKSGRTGYGWRYLRRLPLTMLAMGVVGFLISQLPSQIAMSVEMYPDMSPGAYWTIAFLSSAVIWGPLVNLLVAIRKLKVK